MNIEVSREVQKQLDGFARDEALLSREAHGYLPKTPEDAARFHPHEWVEEAMRRAYVAGRQAGAEKARADMRRSLGLHGGGL